jgi:hypothetical protein
MAVKAKQQRFMARVAGLDEHAKNGSATKRGPGRRHVGGEPGSRLTKERPLRAYVALMNAAAQKRVPKWSGPRDEHGAYTLVGSVYTLDGEFGEPNTREHVIGGAVGGGIPPEYTLRRKWLAGISAQRGY